jgi:hypothetical protein
MDWKDLAGTLVKAGAPIIGTAIGGPIGGMLGNAIGNVVANALGVENTPEAVEHAITTGDPAVVAAQLSAAEAEAQAKWPALARIAEVEAEDRTAQSEAINLTMRAELKTIGAWHWRHLLGYAVLYQTLVFTTLAAYLVLVADIKRVEVFIALLAASVVPMGGVYALLGFVAKSNENIKIAAVTGEKPPTVATTIAKAVVKKK